MKREEVLNTAMKCVCGDREQDYGTPESNFGQICGLWTQYLSASGKLVGRIDGKDVAAMMALVKIARISTGHAKDDNWIDLAGYAACGGELEDA